MLLLLLPRTDFFQSHRCHQKTFVNKVCYVRVGNLDKIWENEPIK